MYSITRRRNTKTHTENNKNENNKKNIIMRNTYIYIYTCIYVYMCASLSLHLDTSVLGHCVPIDGERGSFSS